MDAHPGDREIMKVSTLFEILREFDAGQDPPHLTLMGWQAHLRHD